MRFREWLMNTISGVAYVVGLWVLGWLGGLVCFVLLGLYLSAGS